MTDKEPLSMYRKLLGYNGGDKKYPIFAPMAGALVTQALIHCCQCREAISGTMGPRRDAWCISCTDEHIETVEKEKKEEARKKENDAIAARKKAEAEALEAEEESKKNFLDDG